MGTRRTKKGGIALKPKKTDGRPRRSRLDLAEEFRHVDTWITALAFPALVVFLLFEAYGALSGTLFSLDRRLLSIGGICFLLYLGAMLRAMRTGNRALLRFLLVFCFAFYVCMLCQFTLGDASLGRRVEAYGVGAERREYYRRWFVNLRPFASIGNYLRGRWYGYFSRGTVLWNLLGNFCMMMPFAFFLPELFRPLRRWYFFLPTVALLSAAIESAQFLLTVGSCDVDDLILNASGAFLFFLLLKIPPLARFCDRAAGKG